MMAVHKYQKKNNKINGERVMPANDLTATRASQGLN